MTKEDCGQLCPGKEQRNTWHHLHESVRSLWSSVQMESSGKLNAPMHVAHRNVGKRTRHLTASSEIHALRYCQWFLIPEFFNCTKFMFQTNRKLSFRNNLLMSWYMGCHSDNLCPHQAMLLQTVPIPSLLLRLIFVVMKNDIHDCSTVHIH